MAIHKLVSNFDTTYNDSLINSDGIIICNTKNGSSSKCWLDYGDVHEPEWINVESYSNKRKYTKLVIPYNTRNNSLDRIFAKSFKLGLRESPLFFKGFFYRSCPNPLDVTAEQFILHYTNEDLSYRFYTCIRYIVETYPSATLYDETLGIFKNMFCSTRKGGQSHMLILNAFLKALEYKFGKVRSVSNVGSYPYGICSYLITFSRLSMLV